MDTQEAGYPVQLRQKSKGESGGPFTATEIAKSINLFGQLG
jgi:hypothetical protein